ncbi:MAG: hypothetical protein Q8878_09205, partial [Bacillota bacterium]|nr:hypothetical protein [Bacillota bacterium]
NLQEKLYLTAALAYIGDLDSAKVSYDKLLSGRLGHNDPWVFVCGSDNKGADMECTALAAITAMALGEDDTEPMMRYIIENSSDSVETCLEKLMYIRNYSPVETEKSSFSYFENGKKKIVTLENNQAVMLSLTADDLKSANFKTVSGNVGVCASFIGSPDEITESNAKYVTLKKTVEKVGGGKISQSDLVRITLTPAFDKDAPKGVYELSDWIPSGLRYASCEGTWNSNWWMENVETQKISFSVINIDKSDKNQSNMKAASIVYYARATLTGSFVSDSAYINHAGTSAWGMSERKEITVGEK